MLAVVDQLAGCAVPASALEPLVLASRVVDYARAMLDELTATGEVLWAGHGTLPGTDGWVSLHLADSAHLTLPDHGELEATPLHDAVLEALAGGGAYFFRQLADAVGAHRRRAPLEAALWDLVWAGRLEQRHPRPAARADRAAAAPRTGRAGRRAPGARSRRGRRRPRTADPHRSADDGRALVAAARARAGPTRRAHASAEGLLERHGVVTRGAVTTERVPGGFAGVYKVLSAFEDSGRCRRGYFVAGLGAAQFGVPGAVDRLRSFSPT